MEWVDLRSDTVTKPTPEMREAMARAEVGDDVYGEDPTINLLQELAASKTGHEAGLFVPSGTMGNLAAILVHCRRGDEVMLGSQSHVYLSEGGGISAFGGIHSCQIKEQADGSLALADLEANIRPDDDHDPITSLIEIENTHNGRGGVYQTPEYTRKLVEFAHARGIAVHIDGARIFNAAAAQGIDVRELTSAVDSVTFCISKGLCAPVGSVLCGSKEFIRKAKRMRKHLGGGMRQAGVVAAAGIVALETMTTRLVEDHARARDLAEGLSEVSGLVLDSGSPATNMIFFNLAPHINLSETEIQERMKKHGVLISSSGPRRFRLVTHYWINDAAVSQAIEVFKQVLQ